MKAKYDLAKMNKVSSDDFVVQPASGQPQEIQADQIRFALDQQAMSRFHALLDAPLKDNSAVRRLLDTPAPWDTTR
jgi:uncharacterized protein (DUF1778 family)